MPFVSDFSSSGASETGHSPKIGCTPSSDRATRSLGSTFAETCQKPSHQISGEERRVRRRGDDKPALWSIGYCPFKAGMDARKGACVIAEAVLDEGQIERRKAGQGHHWH